MAVPVFFELSGPGISPYAIRGVTQTYAWIEQAAKVRRNINGKALNLGLAQFNKLSTVVSCSDMAPPTLIPLGTELTVKCAQWLNYKSSDPRPRPLVPGSVEYTDAGFTFFRPQLVCLLTDLQISGDVWRAGVQWSMTLVEKGT